jgi:hypothetical protein
VLVGGKFMVRWRHIAFVACLLVAVADGGRADGAKPAKFARETADGVKVLQAWYSEDTGLYAAPTDWWNAGNAMTVLANYEKVTGDRQDDAVLGNTFVAAQK